LQEITPHELEIIQRAKLHIKRDADGWTALHYAAAAHKVKIVRQLLQLGADPDAADGVHGLRPLHLACMGRVKSAVQLQQLRKASEQLYDLQVGCEV
jgi:ankyrin repeat protein